MLNNTQKTKLIATGKTKEIWGTSSKNLAIFVSKDYLTVGDGVRHDDVMYLYRPDIPIAGQEPFASIADYSYKNSKYMIDKMTEVAIKTFLTLEKARQNVEGNL